MERSFNVQYAENLGMAMGRLIEGNIGVTGSQLIERHLCKESHMKNVSHPDRDTANSVFRCRFTVSQSVALKGAA